MTGPNESLAQRIIAKIFADHFKPGLRQIAFRREDLIAAAEALGEPRPKNLGDIIYSLRYRIPLPESVRKKKLRWAASGQSSLVGPLSM